MDVLIALIISVAIFFTVSCVASIIIEYKKYEVFMNNGEIQKAIKEEVVKAEFEITKIEEKKEKVKEKKKPGRKKKVEEEK